jgi:hypothetical protein
MVGSEAGMAGDPFDRRGMTNRIRFPALFQLFFALVPG